MKKTAEQEVQLKLAIRDLVVRNPLISGHQLCRDLVAKGFRLVRNGLFFFREAVASSYLDRYLI
jgi:hypothetical protein